MTTDDKPAPGSPLPGEDIANLPLEAIPVLSDRLREALRRRIHGGDMSPALGKTISELHRETTMCRLCGSKEDLGFLRAGGIPRGIVCRKCAEIVRKEVGLGTDG